MATDISERDLLQAIRKNIADDQPKCDYEIFLERCRPEATELEILRRQRAIAESYLDQPKLFALIEQYNTFRADHFNWFWDNRGFVEVLYRQFDLHLVSYSEQRRMAVDQAAKHFAARRASSESISIAHESLPVTLVHAGRIENAFETFEYFTGFVRRYKGPTGNEPEVSADELQLVITPAGTNRGDIQAVSPITSW